jgi:N,N'-diacetyllegionaminate synthase
MIFNKTITIGDHTISENSPVFIIAEAGVNHNGNMNLAKKLIDIAAEAKADAVKFQAFKAENLILKDVKKAPYQEVTTAAAETQFEMLKKLELTKAQNKELLDYCRKKNIIFLATPFDEGSLEELNELDLPAYKVASTDLTNLLFLKKIAAKGKPVILSTGMSYQSEVDAALEEIHPYNKNVILLQCTSNYPIEDFEVNLNVITTFKKKYKILVGFSDHSVGVGAAPYAVPLGARVIEKHFTTDKELPGPDHRASLSPGELKKFVMEIRKVECYLGSKTKEPVTSEINTRASLQKCLVAVRKIEKGNIITEKDIIGKRTGGTGISPINYRMVLGKKASRNYSVNDIINEK